MTKKEKELAAQVIVLLDALKGETTKTHLRENIELLIMKLERAII